MLKDRISNPSLFAISSLVKKKCQKSIVGDEDEVEGNDDDLEENGEPQVIIEPDGVNESEEDCEVQNTLETGNNANNLRN